MKEIQLTQGLVALVDDEDYEYLNQWKWHAHKQTRSGYRAIRAVNKKIIIMARVIMGLEDKGLLIDHKDRNGLNNQKSNLRLCTKQQNNFNKTPHKTSTSKYLGVCLEKRLKNRKWRATITHNYKQIPLGRFENEQDAAAAYNLKAKELFGEFANLNHVE